MSVRVAESLLKLRGQIDAMAPGRDTSSDGPIGDPSYQARKSDYAPNSDGVVTAIDITHDPAHGVDAGEIAEELRLSKDARIKYVISDGRVFSSQVEPWQWRPYMGADAHPGQVHVAAVNDKARYDDTRPWAIKRTAKVSEPPQVTEPSQALEPPRYAAPPQPPLERASQRSTNIIATVFGGAGEDESSAYDGHRIGETEFGVALPFRFEGARPDVKVTNPANGQSVVCKIVDVGPANTNDPYWESESRPQAESGRDKRGRLTNRAGISLTPAAARAISLDGKGPVDWEFVVERPKVDWEFAGPSEVDREAGVQVDELVQRLERLESVVEKTSRDDIPLRPSGYEAFPTIPSDVSAWQPAAGARALNEALSAAQMRSLSPARRMAPAPAPSGGIISGGRAPGDSRFPTAGLPLPEEPMTFRLPPTGSVPTAPDAIGASLEQLMRLLVARRQTPGTTATPPLAAPQTEQVRQTIEMLSAILAPGPDGKAPPLGQVNAALGDTLGNLLNGKKTAIGVLGTLVTSILSQVPAGSGLGQVLALLTPTAGLSPFAMPIFLAMAAWGVLGKFEKWSQQTAVAEGAPLSATSDTLQRNMDVIKLLLPLLSNTGVTPPPPPLTPTPAPIQDVPRGPVAAARPFAEPTEDLVDCSVFGPPAAPPGESILIQVFLHLPEQAQRASFMASLMDSSAALKGTQSLQTEIKRGATVEISLSANTLVVEEPVQSVVWQGQPVFCQFLVAIPPGTNGQNFFPNVRVSVDGRLVGRIMFRLSSDRSAASLQSMPLGEHARRYRFAFVSYATEDRREVLKRVQMLEIMRTRYFQDLLSLDPGDRWERKLYENIDQCDLFLLFWSQAAKDSRWVMREAEYALGRQRHDPSAEPDIVPVILQQNVLPPPSLAELHFNDRIHYMIAATP
jgi:TIR domain